MSKDKRLTLLETLWRWLLGSNSSQLVDSLKSNSEESIKGTKPNHNRWTSPIEGKGLRPDSIWGGDRKVILERDNYTCANCSVHGENLQVHHIQSLKLGGNNAYSNLVTLCKDCHEGVHHRKFDQAFDANDSYGYNYRIDAKVAALAGAQERHNSVDISYIDALGLHSYRVIHPQKLYKNYKTYINNKSYVDAYCELDKAPRTFRISRMTIIEGNEDGSKHPRNLYKNK
jgi:5-methylcytosine-specific restriction endonuclease McrA